eukprot:m.88990 g.88990  ORF g.88990 m.88990 type:complete len:68 (+) comp12874_c0_seq1:684-887(+)
MNINKSSEPNRANNNNSTTDVMLSLSTYLASRTYTVEAQTMGLASIFYAACCITITGMLANKRYNQP